MSAEVALVVFVAAFSILGLLLALFLKARMRVSRKGMATTVIGFGFLGWFFVYCAAHAQAERKSRLIGARSVLRQAYDEYIRTGILPSRNGSWSIIAYTNDVVVSGRRIQMAAATSLADIDPSWGSFAIAPSGELVWLRSDRAPVVVSASDYTVPLWSDGY
jgi:hypothetical protein